MRQSFLGDLGNLLDDSQYAHGGDRRHMAEQAGCAPEELIDFSVSLNPLGPPEWLARELSRAAAEVDRYPDNDSPDVTLAACELFKVWPTQVMAGSGATELLHAATSLAAARGAKQAVTPAPTYVDYSRVSELCGLQKRTVPLSSKDDFALDMNRLEAALDRPSAVFLCHPNNPTGTALDADAVRTLAGRHPESTFIVDESFADFDPQLGRLVRRRPENVVVIHSLTKFFAIPGLRLGLTFADPETILRLKKRLPTWSVNVAAQRVGARALKDTDYHRRTIDETTRLRNDLRRELLDVPGLRVFPAHANYLLCRTDRVGATAKPLYDFLLSRRMPVRLCANFDGLDERYFRIGLRGEEDNGRLVDALREYSGLSPRRLTQTVRQEGRTTRRTPAIMVQGTCSDAGKSVLTAALCRILLQDGYRVAPFKAQNMSNNSFVTASGGEMGRAQVTQAEACRLAPDVRMNPVLLKPGSDTGSQVVIMGKAVGNMGVAQYHQFKPKAFEAVKQAYDSLAAEFDVIVLEGAGSPAEINLKAHDIVNMAMAEYADCPVLLAGDIDRGGVYASLAGTMSLLPEEERQRVCGYALNKFRGDESLLKPANDAIFELTGKNVLGVIPWQPDLGLPEEDSVAFKTRRANVCAEGDKLPEDQCLDVVVLDLPRISNFNDLDPLAAERDVRLRVVDSAVDMGEPDLIIIPGSKATVADMKSLKGAGLAAMLRTMAQDFDGTTEIVGICGGFQMLGEAIEDPFGLESRQREVRGFGLLPLRTVMERDKTLSRSCGTHAPSGTRVAGYEIHHGQTDALSPKVQPVMHDDEGRPLGWGKDRIWGTYLHGLFDEDGFRRAFLNDLRERKGLEPLEPSIARRNLDDALDRLADVVRARLDMRAIYSAMGLNHGEQARLV